MVTPREGRVSRNLSAHAQKSSSPVTPREGRVSRNDAISEIETELEGHAPRGACE